MATFTPRTIGGPLEQQVPVGSTHQNRAEDLAAAGCRHGLKGDTVVRERLPLAMAPAWTDLAGQLPPVLRARDSIIPGENNVPLSSTHFFLFVCLFYVNPLLLSSNTPEESISLCYRWL